MKSLVSIIIPIYNVGDFLEDCVTSVLAQTYENLQIILVDDGSTDGSGQLADQLGGRDARIQVLHKANGGLSSARNVGLDLVKGEYLCFVDSDDCLSENYIESLLKAMDETGAKVAMCDLKHVPENYQWASEADEAGNQLEVRSQEELFFTMAYLTHSDMEITVIACNKLYQSNLWTNLRFEEGKLHEDQFFIHHLIGLAGDFAYLKKPLYLYRQREGSITAKESTYDERHLDIVEAYRNRFFYYQKNRGSLVSERNYQEMILSYLEMITVEYHNANKEFDSHKKKRKGMTKTNQNIKNLMQCALTDAKSDLTLRKRMKYMLFLMNPKLYYKRFWKETR